mmetsp:Transcript_16590/g.20995  ORF Transcript_16590/g.20995 Transcript_16590/m.20995 type:complete len:160 (+) Transcript_16590:505-984(+)
MADIAVSQEEISVAPTVQSRPFGPPKLPFSGRHMQSAGGWGQSNDQSGFNGNDFSSAYAGYEWAPPEGLMEARFEVDPHAVAAATIAADQPVEDEFSFGADLGIEEEVVLAAEPEPEVIEPESGDEEVVVEGEVEEGAEEERELDDKGRYVLPEGLVYD